MNAQTQQKGFTIIEVVLVLAIAALIFLMIFVALPALQRGQANTARKNDATAVASSINTYRTNSNGSLPDTAADLEEYIDDLSQLEINPTNGFRTGAGSVETTDANLDYYTVFIRAQCNEGTTETTDVVDGGNRQAAVVTILEVSAGSYDTFCQDS